MRRVVCREFGPPERLVLSRYPGMAHGFFTMAGTVDASRAAIEQAASQLREWFSPGK